MISECACDHIGHSSSIDIVCFPDMAWDYPLWTNRQQGMQRLPRAYPQVRVLYVSPPRFVFSQFKHRRSRSKTDAGCSQGWITQLSERLWVLQPLIPVPNK